MARERLPGLGEFFRERGDEGLGVARQLSLEILDLVFKSGDEANDSFEPLIVKPADGRMAKNEYPLCADGIGWRRAWKISGKGGMLMAVQCALLVAG